MKNLDLTPNVASITMHCGFEEIVFVEFEGVVNFLKQAIPVGTIYNISADRRKLDLIVVLEKCRCVALDNFSDTIEMSLLGFEGSICTLHSFGGLNQQLTSGNLFYNWACTEAHLIYRKSIAEQLPSVGGEIYTHKMGIYHRIFKIEMAKACSFLDGAKQFIIARRYELAVFMLQQAVELTYRCFLNLLRGKDIKCHALYVLRRNISRYAPGLLGVFSENEKEELFYLEMLEKGYCEARYNRDYVVKKETVQYLYEKVWKLHARAFDLFAKLMINIERNVFKASTTS